jgi:hypothetical protein
VIDPSSFLMREIRERFISLAPSERSRLILEWGEDQAYVFGYLVNLGDDFPEAIHEGFFDAALQLNEAFARTGMPVELVSDEVLGEVLRELVDEASVRSSPAMLAELVLSVEISAKMPIEDPVLLDRVELILQSLIECFERSVPERLN